MNARIIVLILLVIAIGGSIYYLEKLKAPRIEVGDIGDAGTPIIPREELSGANNSIASTTASVTGATAPSAKSTPAPVVNKKEKYKLAVEIAAPSGYVNTAPDLTIQSLIGKKVIMVDFWTYSCINCQRTTPYLNAWYKKYKDQGLEIVSIHTPEFEFEKKIENVEAATKRFGIQYPVVLDNDYGTWQAYGNRYWPHKYLIDIDGYVVYDHIGEGSYDETEAKIQQLLAERAQVLGQAVNLAKDMVHPTSTIGTDLDKINSPETYFGASRNNLLANGTPGSTGIQMLTMPPLLLANRLYLAGEWSFMSEFAQSQGTARIAYKYNSKEVYIVVSSDSGIKIKVLRDGKPLVAGVVGEDVSLSDSTVTIKEERLYKLIQDKSGYGEHTIELIIEQPGLRAFTFTFG